MAKKPSRKPNTAADVKRAFARLKKKLGRTPRSTEIVAEIGNAVSAQRVRQIMAAAALPTYNLPQNRVELDRPVMSTTPLQRRIVLNLRRLYRDELATKKPRTDKQIALAFGYNLPPAKAAVEMRRYFHADRVVSTVDMIERFASAFGVDPSELLRPIEGAS